MEGSVYTEMSVPVSILSLGSLYSGTSCGSVWSGLIKRLLSSNARWREILLKRKLKINVK
jgi:hypothetical protein